MVKDDHPSNVTPITDTVPITHPGTVTQAAAHLTRKSVAREKSKQPMAHTGIQSDKVQSWIPLIWLVLW